MRRGRDDCPKDIQDHGRAHKNPLSRSIGMTTTAKGILCWELAVLLAAPAWGQENTNKETQRWAAYLLFS